MNPPSSPIRRKQQTIPGFRPSPRPQRPPISAMTIRELQDLHKLNSKILSSPGASTSTYVQRILTEQAAIESRLLEVDGMEKINSGLKRAKIKGEGDMDLDEAPEPTTSRTIEAKRKALAQYGSMRRPGEASSNSNQGGFTLQQAIELERQAHLQDQERQQRNLEKKKRMGIPIRGEILTRQEQEARIWAFMTHKPTESDMEDDDEDEDSDEEDPASWFEDDQDDGIKGQDIIEPDFEDDLAQIIQVDESRIPYNTFYQPRCEAE